MKSSLLALGLLAALPFAASATDGLSYNYVEGGYVNTDAKGGDAQFFQRGLVRDGGNRCQIFGLQIVKPVHHAPPLGRDGASGKALRMQEAAGLSRATQGLC